MEKLFSIIFGLISLHAISGEQELPELCNMPAKVGDCRAAIPRYYFNNQTNQCEKFSYGGCGGNDNNFLRLEDCQTCCSDSTHECVCSLPPKSGPCEAYIPRFYYDSAQGNCKSFIYGGCKPNSNNFETIDKCVATCQK